MGIVMFGKYRWKSRRDWKKVKVKAPEGTSSQRNRPLKTCSCFKVSGVQKTDESGRDDASLRESFHNAYSCESLYIYKSDLQHRGKAASDMEVRRRARERTSQLWSLGWMHSSRGSSVMSQQDDSPSGERFLFACTSKVGSTNQICIKKGDFPFDG